MASLTTTDKIAAQLTRLSSNQFKAKLNKILMIEALEQVDLGFEQSRDPYGQRWKPLTARRGQPLRDTGRLQRSFSGSSDAAGFRIGTDVIYAAVHQFGHTFPARAQAVNRKGRFKKNASAGKRTKVRALGARVVPARPMLPSGRFGAIWTRALEKAAKILADKEAP
jgi:phage gpG-like protein